MSERFHINYFAVIFIPAVVIFGVGRWILTGKGFYTN